MSFRFRLAVVLLTAACASPALVAAQPTAYVLFGPSLMRVVFDPLSVSTRTIPDLGWQPYVTPDGRFMVWMETNAFGGGHDYALSLSDLVTGDVTRLPGAYAGRFDGNPRRPEIYLRDATGAIALSPQGARRLRDFPCDYLTTVDVSADGRRVLYLCIAGTTGVVLDTTTGATVMSLADSDVLWAALSNDGRSLFTTSVQLGGAQVMRRYDLDTGMVAAERTFARDPQLSVRTFQVEPKSNALYPSGGTSQILDPVTLQDSGVPSPGSATWAFDPASTAAIMLRRYDVDFGIPMCDIVVIGTPAPVQGPSGLRDCPPAIFAPIPSAPVSLSAVVDGSSVQLNWNAGPPTATSTRYLVEAGTSPGAANIGSFDVGLLTTFVASGVPPGTYYVRIRAANYTGSSRPSAEVVVRVP